MERKERENLRHVCEKHIIDAKATVKVEDIEEVVAERTDVALGTIRQQCRAAEARSEEG